MREIFGQVALTVTVMIGTIAEVVIAVEANVLALHTHVLTRHIHIAFIAPEVAVVIVAIADLLVTNIAVMLVHLVVSAIDDSVATVAVVVLIFIYVITNKRSATSVFVTVAVVIIVDAPDGNPYAAPIAGVIAVTIIVVGIIKIFLAFGFLAANVASGVFVLIDVFPAHQLRATFVAPEVAVGIHAHIRHPCAALITEVIAVTIDVLLAELLHTVSRFAALFASSVVIPVEAIVAQPQTAIIAEVIVVAVIVHKIVILIAPLKILDTSVAESVLVFVDVLVARN